MNNLRFGLAIIAATVSAPTLFAAGEEMIVDTHQTSEYVNFAGTGPLGVPSDTLPGGQKFFSIKIRNTTRSSRIPLGDSNCMDISTAPASILTMDTRIWLRKPDGSLISLSDDVGSSKFSRVMAEVDFAYAPYTPPGTQNSVELLIAAKSAADNAGDFYVYKTTGLPFNTCYYETAPFVDVDSHSTLTLYRTN